MKGNFGDFRLKPLLLCCGTERRDYDSPEKVAEHPFFQNIEVALSESSFEKGFFRKISGKLPVYLSSDCEGILQRLGLFDLVIASPLSLNTLAKFSLGIRDSFPSKILGAAVDKGIPLMLDSSEVPGSDSGLNPHFIKIYRRYWDNLLIGSIKGFAWEKFSETASAIIRQKRQESGIKAVPGRCVITRDDVLAAKDGIGILKIPRNSLVTDLAREEALRWGVNIEFE